MGIEIYPGEDLLAERVCNASKMCRLNRIDSMGWLQAGCRELRAGARSGSGSRSDEKTAKADVGRWRLVGTCW